MNDHDKYPFGVPTNRPEPKPDLTPSTTRGVGWHVDRKGRDVYVEPPRPKPAAPAKTSAPDPEWPECYLYGYALLNACPDLAFGF